MVKSPLTGRKRRLLLTAELATLAAALIILLVFAVSSLDGVLIRSGQGAAVITSVLVDLANTDRSSNSVDELTISPTLTAIAQAKANDMAEKGYFAHTSPEGKDPWYWFKQGGYIFTYAGENLAVDFSDSADVERAWMNSPTHRANLLSQHFTQIGIATAVGMYNGHRTTFVVQEFGTPAHVAAAAPQAVTAPTKPTEMAIATTVKPKAKPAPATPAATAPVSPAATTTLAQAAEPTTSPEAVLGSSAEGLASPEATARPGLTAVWNILAASPKTTLHYAFYLFGFLILIALLIETGLEFRRHHLKHVALALVLIALMGALFLAANSLVFTSPIIVDRGEATTGA